MFIYEALNLLKVMRMCTLEILLKIMVAYKINDEEVDDGQKYLIDFQSR